MGVLSFDGWSGLNESAKFDDIIDRVKSACEPTLGNLHVVKDLQTFKRKGEPEQTSILFSNDKLQSFAVNVVKANDKVYSVDIWRPESKEPVATAYSNKTSFDDLLQHLPGIVEDPKVNEDETTVAVAAPKVKVDATPSVTKMEDEYVFADNNDELFDQIRSYVDMVIKGKQPALMLTGMPGLGKTKIVKERLDAAGMKRDVDYVKITGTASAVGMYTELFENNGRFIMFDDCDGIFDDKDGVNVLKGALDSDDREISWAKAGKMKTSDGHPVPKRFEFTGKIIFISNKSIKTLPPALKSRSFIMEGALRPKDMADYMEKNIDGFMPEEPLSERKFALNTIKAIAKEDSKVKIDWRTFQKAMRILDSVHDLAKAKKMIAQQAYN